ncbi:hypothetical protein ACIRPH_19720 [Nocardiopsis sp. NPDC101807]|uniref:hypothetical protein n=1 Tax=Nocardiopsis sp. NPDC101807 TaxID=3364339 RepID=UPI003808260B
MQKTVFATTPSGNFNLKNEVVELIPTGAASRHAALDLASLEAIRTSQATVPASKYGLEAICGASCETGAQ